MILRSQLSELELEGGRKKEDKPVLLIENGLHSIVDLDGI
jgi:hypothetical protein